MLLPLLVAAIATAAPAPTAGANGLKAVLTDRDVAPLLATGPAARARAEFEAERWAKAAKALAARKEPEARWLAALALARDGRHVEAIPLLDGLAARLPAISDRVELRLGQALDAAGRRREAADAYARVPAGSLQYGAAVLARARALDALDDGEGAVATLVPLLALRTPANVTPDGVAEAMLLAGRIRARAGDADFARHAWLQCWADYPLTAAGDDCGKALSQLPGGGAVDAAGHVRRAEALLDANRNRGAMNELEPLLATLPALSTSDPLACRARFAYGKALRRERQYTRALAELAPVVDHCTDPDLRVKALYVLSSATANAAPEDGIVRYAQLAREYPTHTYADDALFHAADLHALAGRLEDARAVLVALAEQYPRGDFRAEALFRIGWLTRKLGDRDGAIEAFARVEEAYADDPYETARAAYWRARVLEERGHPGDAALAAEAWAGIADRYPADYYGLLAQARLDERHLSLQAEGPREKPSSAKRASVKRSGPQAPSGFRYATGPLRSDPHLAAGLLLLRLGLRDAAAQELAAVDRSRLSTDDPDPLLLLAELLDRAGDHRDAHLLVRTVGRSALKGRPEGAAERIWRIAYPPAYRDEVTRWARASGVEPDLLQAIMREESALDPRVVSAAGAVGLTQLMVPTAQDSAKKLKLRRTITTADLMDPRTNIRLGAHHLGTLVKRFRGSSPLAIAAYNIGQAPVLRWIRERGGQPLDEFIEEIPVQETRGYVKRVLRSYAAYHLLVGGDRTEALALGQPLPQLE